MPSIPQGTGRPPQDGESPPQHGTTSKDKSPQPGLLTPSSSTGSTQGEMWGWVLVFIGVRGGIYRVQLGPSSSKRSRGWERG